MIIFYLLAMYAISFWARNLDGPFDLFTKIRAKLFGIQFLKLGVVFYKLFYCPWCTGFHSGYLVYLLAFQSFNLRDMFIWSLAGSTLTALLDSVYSYLQSD